METQCRGERWTDLRQWKPLDVGTRWSTSLGGDGKSGGLCEASEHRGSAIGRTLESTVDEVAGDEPGVGIGGPQFGGGRHLGEGYARPSEHRTDERFAERDETDDRRMRITRQPHERHPPIASLSLSLVELLEMTEMTEMAEIGEEHWVARPNGDAVDVNDAVIAVDRGSQVVARTSGGSAGSDDEIGSLGRSSESRSDVIELIDHVNDTGALGAHPGKPARQLRAERVANTAIGRDPGMLEFIAENDDVHAWTPHHGHVIMTGGGEESSERRRDLGADPGNVITGPALLTGPSNI